MLAELFFIGSLLVTAMLSACGKADPAEAARSGVAPSAAERGAVSPTVRESSASSSAGRAGASADPPLAAEIVAFRERRDACDHFRGEEPYDPKRAAFLAAEVSKNCAGTDRALADLRRRYASDAGAMAALEAYEDKIE